MGKEEKEDLEFVEVSENAYKIRNRKTGRFHNFELGIDEVM